MSKRKIESTNPLVTSTNNEIYVRKDVHVMPTPWKNWFVGAKSVEGNEMHGSGSQSRYILSFEKLSEAGWSIINKYMASSSGVKVFLLIFLY